MAVESTMKTIIIFSAFVTIIRSAAVPLRDFDSEDKKLQSLRKVAELLYGDFQNNELEDWRKFEDLLEVLPKKLQEDAQLLVPELVAKHGYLCERHWVTTEDGYILELHRIPYGRSGPSENRPPVMLHHGLLSSSADWVIPGPQKGLPYILAEAGYDIWLSNARGNRYSRNHTHLDPDKNGKQFWNFSWHEIGVLDLPATIDYILARTRQEKLFYIGHSQGTTVSYVLCAERPEYNEKFRTVFSFAPTAYLSHITSPIRILAPHVKTLEKMLDNYGVYESISSDESFARLGQLLCNDDSPLQSSCLNVVFMITGFNREQFNASLLPVILGHTPAGASLRQALHYGQVVNSGKFQQWDYGSEDNQNHYGSDTPPEYNLKNIKAPFELFYAGNDFLGNVADVKRLHEQLANAKLHLVPHDKFNHIDYLYAIDAPKLLYEKVINLMSEYQ